MGFRRERASLAGFEVHDIASYPGDVSFFVMFKCALLPLAKHGKAYSKTSIGFLRTRDGLKKQVYWRSSFHGCELCRNVSQTAGLSWDFVFFDETIQGK